jgi:hypothetical protein
VKPGSIDNRNVRVSSDNRVETLSSILQARRRSARRAEAWVLGHPKVTSTVAQVSALLKNGDGAFLGKRGKTCP